MTWYLDANRFIYDSLFVCLVSAKWYPANKHFHAQGLYNFVNSGGGGGFCDYVDNQINAYIRHIFIYFS